LLDARESINVVPLVAKVMAHEMNKDERWINNQLHLFQSIAANYLLKN
jgi:glycerol-3-phosphate dehydrogenase